MFRNLDKIKNNLGADLYNHIGSLNKAKLQKQLKELRSELSRISNKKDSRYYKLKDEEFFILYRLERANEFKYAKGGKTEENMGVQFSEYRGKQIMFEPYFEKYYTNDIEFDTMEEAKKYIDSGSKKQSWQVSAYRTGKMAKGGKMAETKKETYYIDFLNKKKNFSIDRVTFDDYEKARKWAMKNFESFDPDMIKIKYLNGGTMNTTENLKRRLKFIAEDVDRLFETLPQEVLDMPVEGWENVKTLLMNIEIATDLSSDESDSWKFGNKMAKGGSILSSNYSIGGL
jgi:hypothetical protein